MKKIFSLILLAGLFFCQPVKAQEITKTGYNFGPLPVIAFDADKGFQYGALLNIYNFGDGTFYPNYKEKWYIEASFYTKGTQFFTLSYDSKHLIPGIRTSFALTRTVDKALDFYGFNGYESFYDPTLGTAFYRMNRQVNMAKADFSGNIWDNKLFWEAGYLFSHTKAGVRAESETSLFENYTKWGLLPESDIDGGITSMLRLGLMYDTRDREGAPSRGIWAEAHTLLAPKFLGGTQAQSYYRYAITFRHYLPLYNDQVVFAYRLNYQGTMGSYAPYYDLPYLSVFGEGFNRDAVGGYRTIRGMMRNRIQGLDVAFFNAEIRYRFVEFALWNQNIAFGVNAFCDGGMTVRPYEMTPNEAFRTEYEAYRALGTAHDQLHLSAGAGLRFIMNQNFIVAFEYGKPFNKQDGNGSFYINTGFLF